MINTATLIKTCQGLSGSSGSDSGVRYELEHSETSHYKLAVATTLDQR